MGDEGVAGPPAKKRGATRQIAKDDSSDSEGESVELSASGSFKKASEDVIASRRIVKVRRTGAAQVPPAPNPFATIRLVAPTTTPGAPSISLASDTPLAPSVEPLGEAAGAKDQVTTSVTKDAGHLDEVQVGKEKAEAAGDSVEAVEDKSHGRTAALDELENENGEGKFEMPEPPKAGDDPKRNEEENEPTSTSVTEKGLEFTNSGDGTLENKGKEDPKSRSDEGGKHGKEDKEPGTSEQDDAAKGEESTALTTTSALDNRSVGMDSLPALGAATVGSFSFGTSPSSLETPTAFASFSSTWASFGSGTASGTSLGSGFAFGKAASEGAFASASSSFGNSNGSSFQLFNTSNSTLLNAGPPQQPPASAVQFQGGITPTGEEQEKMVFGADATLFEFLDAGWKERGKGELRVNVPLDNTGKARLLMRSKGNLRLILNASLFPDMKMASMDSRGVTFACVNSAVEEKSGLATYALKFKDSFAAGNFRDAVDAHKCSPQEGLKTPENSPSSLHGP